MRAKLLQLIARNWPIKLAALFMSLMLYVAVQLQQPVTGSFPIKLNVLVPPGRTLQHKPPTVWVEISGKGSQLLKMRSLPSTITRVVPDTLSGATWTIRLEPTDLELPKGADVHVVEMRPNDLTITLDSAGRKDVRIVSRVSVVADSGQVLRGGVSIAPTIARLVGPEKALAAIESVTTVPTEITHVAGAGPFARSVPIDTLPLGVVRVSPKQVTISGDMTVLAERTFSGVPVETGAGTTTSFIVTPARVSVSVLGPDDRVRALTRDSVRVVAHAGRADGVARITVIVPRGITARATPDSVTLRRPPTPPRARRG